MKEIHRRRNWPLWKCQIVQKYINGTWIWKKTMSFGNDRYCVDKDPYEWCLRQSKMIKAIDPQMIIKIRNQKLLTQMPGELDNAIKCRCNQSCNLDDIANTLQDLRKRKKIGKYSPYKISSFKEKTLFRVNITEIHRERVEEVIKKKNYSHNCWSTDHYSNNCPKGKKKVYAIEQVQEEESSAENSELDSMNDAIREHSDDDQDPKDEFLVKYQEEKQPQI
ncbi:hypothetical protein O181_002329 [Austropuccinia psidii MF-1]|uniref:Uncharacterized protein n=1 Tax=Austropuccinia psidii MF-1 TaxID=1389203 RepID=A0A9Q3BC29_9BASI|nr:hypothetical protein [Austropuccinia psidii MF-1]